MIYFFLIDVTYNSLVIGMLFKDSKLSHKVETLSLLYQVGNK